MSDGAIIDKLVCLIRRDGPLQKHYDSVPVTIWRKAMRRA